MKTFNAGAPLHNCTVHGAAYKLYNFTLLPGGRTGN